MWEKYFSRVDRQVAALIGIILLLLSFSIYYTSIRICYNAILKNIAGRMENIHQYIEHQLEPEDFLEINSKEDMNKPRYQYLKERMKEVREIGDLMYFYTAKKDEKGNLVYVVDGLPLEAYDFRYPGDLIESEIQAELNRALKGEIVLPEEILNTYWGNIFIAYYPLHDESGNVVGALGIEVAANTEVKAFREVSKTVSITCLFFYIIAFSISISIFRRISNPMYKDIANTDFMTKLKNRNSYEIDKNNLKAKKKLNNLVVAVIDVNNLKLVNDKLGHDVGDECIIKAAKILGKLESDKITVYRYGGDEFVMLMEDRANLDIFFRNIQEKFKKYVENLTVPVSLAIGYATFDEIFDKDIADTQKRADKKMYQNKMKIKEFLSNNINDNKK